MITLIDSAGVRHTGLSGVLSMPLRGAWTACVETGDDAAPEGPCTLEIERTGAAAPGVDTFVGTIRYGGTWQGRSEVVVVGGAARLRFDLEPKHFAARVAPVPAELLARAILTEAGEPDGALDGLDGLAVGQWTRVRSHAGVALSELADAIGVEWRVQADGTVWMGTETWPDATPEDLGYQTTQRPDARIIEAAPDQATLRPGVVVAGERIKRVVYTIGGDGIRVALAYGLDDRSETAEAIRKMLPSFTHRGSFGATVVQQRADDTLDLQVDDDELPDLTRVPLRSGIAGARMQPKPGDRVRVAFEGASPAGAYAFASDMLAEDDADLKRVARVGDAVDLGFWVIVPFGPSGFRLEAATESTPGAHRLRGTITEGSPRLSIR